MTALDKFVIMLIVILITSCKGDDTTREDELRFKLYSLENQGWKSRINSQKIDDIDFTATEVPIQYYILKELGDTDLLMVDSIYEANKAERVIEFAFEQEEQKDLLQEDFTNMDYAESVKYMSFKIQDDFYVVTSKKDTVKCSGVTFERNFKIASFNKVMLFFTGIAPEEKIQLIYQDKLFRKGTIKFKFQETFIKL